MHTLLPGSFWGEIKSLMLHLSSSPASTPLDFTITLPHPGSRIRAVSTTGAHFRLGGRTSLQHRLIDGDSAGYMPS